MGQSTVIWEEISKKDLCSSYLLKKDLCECFCPTVLYIHPWVSTLLGRTGHRIRKVHRSYFRYGDQEHSDA